MDEVNLLDDHVVDVLLDSSAMGVNTIEREGVSFSHPARFTLVGTMNPEEGELRPQLLDRFGLCVNIQGALDPDARLPRVTVDRPLFYEIASFCLEVGVDGHRGDIIILKTAKTLAAYQGREAVTLEDINRAAELALPHRIRRKPLQEVAHDIHALCRENRMANTR